MKIYSCKYFIANFVGISLAPIGIFIKPSRINDPVTINHEMIHWQQQKELLYVGFYLLWLAELAVKGYRNISFEKEAYANQNDLDYLKTRKRFAWRE